jgi:hypothetical protein
MCYIYSSHWASIQSSIQLSIIPNICMIYMFIRLSNSIISELFLTFLHGLSFGCVCHVFFMFVLLIILYLWLL